MNSVPQSIVNQAKDIEYSLLPAKSRKIYEDEYLRFTNWCEKENISVTAVGDEVMLVYLNELSKVMKPSTLWSKFSMIKSILKVKENIDATQFFKSLAFLKRQSVGYIPKKANTLTADQITKFMVEAPDELWLLHKVIVSIGIFGACRIDDLVNLSIEDVEDHKRYFVVSLKEGKTHRKRSFVVNDEGCIFKPCELLRKYLSLRPQHMKGNRLLIAYRNGKCCAQNVGKHTVSHVPRQIAKYLNLENEDSYTGHAFRRSSATLLVEGGADLLTLKRHGGWQSSKVAEGYIEDSIARKAKVSRSLFCTVETDKPQTVTSNQIAESSNQVVELSQTQNDWINVDDIFEESQSVQVSASSTDNGKTACQENFTINAGHTVGKNIVHSKALQNGLNISNNQNCTINITFK